MREGSLLFPIPVLIGIKEPFCGRRGTTSNSPRHMTTMVLPTDLHRKLSLKITVCIVHNVDCLSVFRGEIASGDQAPSLGETACHARRHEVARRDVFSHEELQAARRRGVF